LKNDNKAYYIPSIPDGPREPSSRWPNSPPKGTRSLIVLQNTVAHVTVHRPLLCFLPFSPNPSGWRRRTPARAHRRVAGQRWADALRAHGRHGHGAAGGGRTWRLARASRAPSGRP